MAKLWAIVRREYTERVRTKWFLWGSLVGPLFFSLMIFLPAYLARRGGPSAGTSDIVVIDATGRAMGARVAEAVRAAVQETAGGTTVATPRVRTVDAAGLSSAEALAARQVMRKERQGYLVLDAQTLAGDSAHYVGRNASSLADMNRVENAVRQAVLAYQLEAQGVSAARVDSLTRKRLQLGTERLTEKGRGRANEASITFAFTMAFLLYMAIVLYGQAVLRGVLEEKTSRVAEVVVSSVKPETLLAGKVIGVGAVGLTQMAIWVVVTGYIGSYAAPFLRAANNPMAARPSGATLAAAMPDISLGVILLIILFFLLGYTFYSSLYGAMGSTVNSEQEAQQALMPLFFLIIGSALLIQPVMMNPSSNLARVASIVPFSAPIIMPLRMSLVAVPPLEMALTIALLLAACVGAVWVAGRIYRVGLLMYGKRPTFGEMLRWVRAA